MDNMSVWNLKSYILALAIIFKRGSKRLADFCFCVSLMLILHEVIMPSGDSAEPISIWLVEGFGLFVLSLIIDCTYRRN